MKIASTRKLDCSNDEITNDTIQEQEWSMMMIIQHQIIMVIYNRTFEGP